MLNKTLTANRLFDFYGSLLTDNQRRLIRLYYGEDWSLSEVAEDVGSSRQAVHDGLERALDRLRTYEEKMGLVEEFRQRRRRLVRLRDRLDNEGVDPEILSTVEELIDGDFSTDSNHG